jgi:nucleoid-associated protein YgaU
MYDPTSRYYRLGERFYLNPDGSTTVYSARRLPPTGIPVQSVISVEPGDRLDLIAGRTLGQPVLYWRIADANDALNPFRLLERQSLNIPAIRA